MNAKSKRIAKDAAKTGVYTITGIIGLFLKIIGTILLVIITSGVMYACIFTIYAKTNLTQNLDVALEEVSLSLSSTVYYQDSSTGEYKELCTLDSSEVRKWVEYKDIPDYMEKAAVSIEDKRFYKHHGVDWYRTAGALVNMFLKQRNSFGGSTITQQLIKNTTHNDDVTIARKLTEIFQALEFEKKYDKEQIIEWYLNVVNFGSNIYGIGAAADYYFGKDVSELSLAECASIVGITNNPSAYNPFIDEEANKERQEDILYQMFYQGYITEDEYNKAVNEKLRFDWGDSDDDEETESSGRVYSWFEDALISDLIDDLMEAKGCDEKTANLLLYRGGYSIYATIDPKIQKCVDTIYENLDEVPDVSGSSQQFQSAIVITDPYTGEVKALSGGVGPKTQSLMWNRATDTRRPMGSSIKPLSVYAPAMNMGLITPETRFEDEEDVKLNGTTWMPLNFERDYFGVLTVREAIRRSINTVAAQIVDLETPEAAYEFMTEVLEFKLDPNDASYAPMSLGELTYGATVREASAGYCIFPNAGIFSGSRLYNYVTDPDGNIVMSQDQKHTIALSDTVAYWMIDLMKGSAAYGTDTEPYVCGIPMAGKTGTTDDTKDRWFNAFTPYYVAACWTGYDTPATISAYSNPAAIMWRKVMTLVHEDLDYKDFFTPSSTYLYPVPGVEEAVEYTIRCTDEKGKVLQEEKDEARGGKELKIQAPMIEHYILKGTETEVKFTLTEDPTKNIITFVYTYVDPNPKPSTSPSPISDPQPSVSPAPVTSPDPQTDESR